MNKKEIIPVLLNAAKLYDKNLKNQKFLVISGKPNNLHFFEIKADDTNFLHLTGVVTKLNPSVFYDRLINSRIKESDVKLRNDGTTIKKLSVIEDVMDFKKMAQMTGDYNGRRPKLITDKLVGNVRASIGFIGTSSGSYSPNTVLNGDMRDEIIKSEKVIAILSKKANDISYNKIVKVCKDSDDVKNALEKASKIYKIDFQTIEQT